MQGLQALMSLKCMKFIFVGSYFTCGTRKERSSSVQKTLTTYFQSYQEKAVIYFILDQTNEVFIQSRFEFRENRLGFTP